MNNTNFKYPVHFVLSGGAAKGFAHIGALKAFEELGISPASITGTSAGALFGALYAMYGNFKDCKKKIDEFMNSENYKNFSDKYFSIEINNKKEITRDSIYSFFKKKEKFKEKFNKVSNLISEKFSSIIKETKAIINLFDDEALICSDDILKIYHEIFENNKIENLKIPFAAISTDIRTKSIYCFQKGEITEAVAASTAIPFIFPSVRIDNMILYDGGIMSNLPVNESMQYFGEGIRIGIDVSSPVSPMDEDANFIELVQQIIASSIWAKQLSDRKLCDMVFTPVDKAISLFSFEMKDELINMGYQSVFEKKESIFNELFKLAKVKIKRKSIFSIFNN